MSRYSHYHRRSDTSAHGQDSHRWIISYADFITLLFAFFVVMYAISQVNISKYRVFSDSLKETLSAHEPKAGQTGVKQPTSSIIPTSENSAVGDSSLSMQQTREALVLMANQLELGDRIQLAGNEERLEISLDSTLLFESGSVELNDNAQILIEEIGARLSRVPGSIEVEGYTDNTPVSGGRFSSNWLLSSARAASVVQILQNSHIAPEHLSAIGYGEFKPIADNSTPEGRMKNRRVVLVLHRTLAERPAVKEVDIH